MPRLFTNITLNMLFMHLFNLLYFKSYFALINLLSLVVLLCQFHNSTATVVILIKLLSNRATGPL